MHARWLTDRNPGRWNGIDLVKLCMAFCVIAIHIRPYAPEESTVLFRLYTNMLNCAVPFFFLASGFLLAVKMRWPYSSPDNLPILQRFTKRILRMYLLWNLIYLPTEIAYDYANGTPFSLAVLYYIRRLLFIGEHHNSWQLWYLLATLYAALFILLTVRLRVPFRAMFAIGCVVYLVGLCFFWLHVQEGALSPSLAAARKLLEYTFREGRVLKGFLFLPLGMLFAQKVPRPPIAAAAFAVGLTANLFVGSTFFGWRWRSSRRSACSVWRRVCVCRIGRSTP